MHIEQSNQYYNFCSVNHLSNLSGSFTVLLLHSNSWNHNAAEKCGKMHRSCVDNKEKSKDQKFTVSGVQWCLHRIYCSLFAEEACKWPLQTEHSVWTPNNSPDLKAALDGPNIKTCMKLIVTRNCRCFLFLCVWAHSERECMVSVVINSALHTIFVVKELHNYCHYQNFPIHGTIWPKAAFHMQSYHPCQPFLSVSSVTRLQAICDMFMW